MRACVLCAAVVAACVPVAAAAQAPISEAQALAQIGDDHPRVRAIRATVDLARADVLDAARWPNPRLSVDRESVAGVSETIATVLQPLPITGRRTLERDAARARVDAASLRAGETERRLRAELRHAYAQLAAAQVRERELTRTRDRLGELTTILERREAAGEAAGFDRLRADREAIDVEADRLAAAQDRARAQVILASYLAGPRDANALVVEELAPGPLELPPLDALVEQAERIRGDVLALQRDAAAARLAIRAADRRRVPEPEVIAGTKSSSALGGDVGTVFGVQATLPLFDRGGPERASALAREAAAESSLELLRLTLRAEIAVARAAALDRRTAAARYRATAVATASEVERIAQVSYDAGERSILELLDAYRSLASARTRQAMLDAEARAAEIELEFVSGWEIP